MALTIPNRFANGQTIDAAKFNSNFDAITSWAATTDSTLTSNASSVATNATNIAALGSGAFLAYATTDQNITVAGSYTTVTLSDSATDAFDTGSDFATSTYTCATAGAYQFNVTIRVKGLAAGETLAIYLTKNSTRYEIATFDGDVGTPQNGGMSLMMKGAVNDTFKLEALATTGTSTIDYCYFSGCCVKPD